MTPKQQRFVQEYLVDLNATQAAIRAGYSIKTARSVGAENLTKPDIAAEIAARRAILSQKLEITQERVLQELAAIGFANITDFVQVETAPAEKLGIHPVTGEVVMLPAGWEQCVRVIDTADLPDAKRAAISSVKQTANGIEVKLYDKVQALVQLGKYLGLFEANAAIAPTQACNLFDAIVGIAEEVWADGEDDIPELEATQL